MEAVIFDMDGVIIDSEYAYFESEYETLKEAGVEETKEYFHKFMGTSPVVVWQDAVSRFNLPETPDYYEQVASEKRKEIVLRDGVQTIPNCKQTIKQLFDLGYDLAVASSSPKQEIISNLRSINVLKYFKTLVSGEEMNHSKPSPDIYLEAAKRLSINPEKCIGIEDSFNGIQSVKNAGMFCIAYSDPNYKVKGHEIADVSITRIDEVINLDIIKK